MESSPPMLVSIVPVRLAVLRRVVIGEFARNERAQAHGTPPARRADHGEPRACR